VVLDENGEPVFDFSSPINLWFLDALKSMSAVDFWSQEPLETAELDAGDSYFVDGFNASYNIGTLNMSIPSDGVNDPPTAERLYHAELRRCRRQSGGTHE